ncbi:metallophosphoesterase [Candidatus Woesearchaeota archaeon]|nr:metallophosphoesterase [Candidatus Woesearchaeota archaeon]
MEIINGMEVKDLGLYLVKRKTLVIADIHLGYEGSLNSRGILIPRMQYKDTSDRLEKLLKTINVETIIITGDFKHEFGGISETEWRNILKIIDLLFKYAKRVIIIKGNHDVNLGPIARKRNIELLEYYKIDDILICHGDEILSNDDMRIAHTVIMGHEHPAIGLKDKAKYEIYKCFLKGKWKNKILIVIPSFNVLTTGTDVLRQKLLSPFLKQDLSNFKAYIVGNNEIYNFGKLKNL